MTSTNAMFWPMIAHVVLVYSLYGLLSRRRSRVVREGKVTPAAFRENRDEPAESLVVRNCIANQFELPILFYACGILLYVTEADNLPAVILAWIFVVSRYAHAYVHVTSNILRYRGFFFGLGFIVLAIMWLWLAVWMAFS